MKTLNVDLGDRSYPIFIGQDLLNDAALITPYIHGKQVMIVSNETVAPLYFEKIALLFSGFDLQSVILPDGEKFKNLSILNQIYDGLLTHNFDRSCTLVALGGGVVGDMTGYAAASYQRGVNFIQIPTTLLSQVDSSVGGKTGVNHALGKNMIGAFHQPQCVIADTDVLNTLDNRELSAGIAEVVKYGLLGDLAFFDWLKPNMPALMRREPKALAYAIERSCSDKAKIVAADEKESGQRALLNYGHTFAHAIETGMGYGRWLHGEAVAVGMLMAAQMSCKLGFIESQSVNEIQQLLENAGLPIRAPEEMDVAEFLTLMAKDKKSIAGITRLVLLKKMGQAFLCDDYATEVLINILNQHLHAPS